MDPQQRQTAETFDAYKDNYSQAVDDAVAFTGLSTDFFTKVKADYILELANEHFAAKAPVSVLDIGCGVGNYHQLLAPHFAQLFGVDVSPACIDTARRRNTSVEYKVYDGETLPYESGSFDLAFTICVMHHVPPGLWENFAREMRRVLKPGCLALVFEHNPRNPLTMRVINTCPFDEDAVLLRSEETERLLKGAGFETVSTSFILSVPAKNRFLRQIDRLFSAFPFGAQYFVKATS